MSYSQTIRRTYHPVKLTGHKEGKCKCGKKRRRQTTVWQTSNPFNGWKSTAEILEDLRKELATWKKEPITCKDCE